MKIQVVYPSKSHSAYKIAANEFVSYAEKTADTTAEILIDDEFSFDKSTADFTVLIGSDAVNSATASLYLGKRIDTLGIKYGTDNYLIRTHNIDQREILILAGGSPRATIYAVYRYFELFSGCRWFWDGDRIPRSALKTSDIDLLESPRFDYRGIRYFAHRSLHRFQAEHWSYEDWCREIDWLLKSRLNMFMLRIGTDDLFQRAFPEIVGYPKLGEPLPEAGLGYDDRNLFWSLEYRGELRKRILKYAFERDLIHPEDTGTMTHWYSRTPIDFLEKVNPKLLSQSTTAYSQKTGLVFDVREKENMDYYFKLTKTHIKEYGTPKMFHTIGLAERLFSADREENMRMKLYTYRMLASRLRDEYPNAPLLIASWDLWQKYTPEEVERLVSELDPNQSIILDYTSDALTDNNFTRWGVVEKFPWIFGVFSGFEPDNEIRGVYELINERLKIAKADPMCRGMVLWPELSHGDPLVIYYLTKNAWSDDVPEISALVEQYCRDRYPADIQESMTALWHTFMPTVSLRSWSKCGDEASPITISTFSKISTHSVFDRNWADKHRAALTPFIKARDNALKTLEAISLIPLVDEMTERDLYDIARTLIANYTDATIILIERIYAEDGAYDDLCQAMGQAENLLGLLTEVLSSHSDFSLYDSLMRLREVTETNPNFEITLKHNAECNYCRTQIYENAEYLYLPEMRCVFDEVKRSHLAKTPYVKEALTDKIKDIKENYFSTPLSPIKRKSRPLGEIALAVRDIIKNIEF